MSEGYELLETPGKGDGIFATEPFYQSDIVMLGAIEDDNLDSNLPHASQMAEFRYALHSGMITKVNHSCSPNCGIKLNAAGAHNFVAIQSIAVGDEVTFDYAMRNYSIDYFPDQCRCGASNCRGSITGWKNLPDSFKARYQGFVAPYLVDIDRRMDAELKH